jgi:hypothetical protein
LLLSIATGAALTPACGGETSDSQSGSSRASGAGGTHAGDAAPGLVVAPSDAGKTPFQGFVAAPPEAGSAGGFQGGGFLGGTYIPSPPGAGGSGGFQPVGFLGGTYVPGPTDAGGGRPGLFTPTDAGPEGGGVSPCGGHVCGVIIHPADAGVAIDGGTADAKP